MRTAVAIIGLLILGLLVGLAGAFIQAARWIMSAPWGDTMVPWGLVLIWISLLVIIRGGAWLVGSRWGATAVMAGWLISTIVMSAESPSGDLALSGGGRQMTYLVGGVILGSAACTFRLPARPRNE